MADCHPEERRDEGSDFGFFEGFRDVVVSFAIPKFDEEANSARLAKGRFFARYARSE
jgi:hypothetical protein